MLFNEIHLLCSATALNMGVQFCLVYMWLWRLIFEGHQWAAHITASQILTVIKKGYIQKEVCGLAIDSYVSKESCHPLAFHSSSDRKNFRFTYTNIH